MATVDEISPLITNRVGYLLLADGTGGVGATPPAHNVKATAGNIQHQCYHSQTSSLRHEHQKDPRATSISHANFPELALFAYTRIQSLDLCPIHVHVFNNHGRISSSLFLHRIGKLWNCLPPSLTSIDSLSQFKQELRVHWAKYTFTCRGIDF